MHEVCIILVTSLDFQELFLDCKSSFNEVLVLYGGRGQVNVPCKMVGQVGRSGTGSRPATAQGNFSYGEKKP